MTMFTSPSLGALATALAAAQGEIEDASKSSTNPAFKTKYADLAEVLQTVRPVLSKHGLSVVQTPGSLYEVAGKLVINVATTLLHKSGEFISDTLSVPVTKADAQGIGACVTYGRRYALAAICGISQDDDDGNTAAGKTTKPAAAPAKPKSEPSKGKLSRTELEAAFKAAQKPEELDELAGSYAALAPDDQAALLPIAKAARARVGGGQ